MASTQVKKPTYHIMPRFEISADAGYLELGTIVTDLDELVPLNRGQVIDVPETLRVPTVEIIGHDESRSKAHKHNFGAWVKAYALSVGGASADASIQGDVERNVSFDSLKTVAFDPDDDYVTQSLSNRKVENYFTATNYRSSVFLITGLKIVRGLRYHSSVGLQRGKNAEVAIQEPHSRTSLGVEAGTSSIDAHRISQHIVDDVVVGYRVRSCAYVAASWNVFSGEKKLKEERYLKGAEMYGGGETETQKPEVRYKEVPVEGEDEAQGQAEQDGWGGEEECWVESTK